MNRFRDLNLRVKMLASFALVIALIIALVVIAAWQMTRVGDRYDTVIRHPLTLQSTLREFQSEYRDCRRIAASITMYAGMDGPEHAELYDEEHAAYDRAGALLDRARNTVMTNPELTEEERSRRLANNAILRELFDRYHEEVAEEIISASRERDRERILAVTARAAGIAAETQAKLDEMLLSAAETAQMQVGRARSSAAATVSVLAAISVIAVLAGVAISLCVANRISRPLAPLTRFMHTMATEGDISLTAADAAAIGEFGRSGDEIGRVIAAAAAFVRRVTEIGGVLDRVSNGDLTPRIALLSERDAMGISFKRMLANLNMMCGEITAASMQVSTGASQVTAGAQALSSGATEQAASIEELSSSIAQMADRTRDAACMAEKAAELAGTIRGNAEKSGNQMNELMNAVAEISGASQSIRKIIKTIDEIAFQTNILAVNAAVEAAHAGKYGKGFSVVAGEVRSLAAKSAEAAKETERLIANSIEKAELGVLIAGETSVSLSEIMAGIVENSRLVSEIAAASGEQSRNIDQINIGITQVSQVVHQNSATAEESAAASEEMYGQSAMLQKLVAQFRLRDGPVRQPGRPGRPGQIEQPARRRKLLR